MNNTSLISSNSQNEGIEKNGKNGNPRHILDATNHLPGQLDIFTFLPEAERGLPKRTKKQPATAKQSFTQCIHSGLISKESDLVLEALKKHGPLSSRGLSNLLQIERTNITRAIHTLISLPSSPIKVSRIDTCPVTTRKVQYYSVNPINKGL